jgi:hypothetical protein
MMVGRKMLGLLGLVARWACAKKDGDGMGYVGSAIKIANALYTHASLRWKDTFIGAESI